MIMSLMHNYLRKIFRSKSRTLLTLSGLVLSVFILVFVLVITETAFDIAMYSVNTFKNCNGIVITGNFDYRDYQQIDNRDGYKARLEIVENLSVRLRDLENKIGSDIAIYGKCIQVDGNFNLNMISVDAYSNERYKSELLHGRLINQSDVESKNEVIVIDESLAKLLFGKTDAVGETVNIRANSMEGKVSFAKYNVIGIIKASTQSKAKYDNILKVLKGKKYEYVESDFSYFIPYTTAYNPYNGENGYINIVCESEKTHYKSIVSDVRTLNLSTSYSIMDADNMYAEISSQIEDSRTTMMYAMFFVFVISGLCIMNTMMFSVKERINEIGIRKAIGAFNSDIITQFLFEGFVYGVISGIIGLVISSWIICTGFLLLKDSLFVVERVVISLETVVLAITLSTIVGIVASLVPAIYASRIKVSDALKFD